MLNRIRARATAAASAAVVAVAVAGLAGCADPSAVAAPTAPNPAAAAQADTIYASLTDQIYGTPRVRVAAQALQAQRIQNAIASCMQHAGRQYTPAPSDGNASGVIVVDDLTSVAPLGRDGFGLAADREAVSRAYAATTNPGFDKLTTNADRTAYGKDLNACLPNDPTLENPIAPAGQTTLATALTKIFTAIEAQPAVKTMLADYKTCLGQHGYQAATWLDMYQLAFGKYPSTAKAWTVLQHDTAWTSAVAYEKSAGQADDACRQPVHQYVMSAALPQLQTFTADHAAQFTQLTNDWTTITNQITAAGIHI